MSPPSALRAAARLLARELFLEMARCTVATASFELADAAASFERAQRLSKGVTYFHARLRGAA